MYKNGHLSIVQVQSAFQKKLFHIHGRSVYEMGRRPRLWESQAEMRRL